MVPSDKITTDHCIVIPFFERLDQVSRCVAGLIDQSLPETKILLVNDGTPTADVELGLQEILKSNLVTLIRHDKNRGVSAARNSAIEWCRANSIEIIIMIDSDCEPGADFISGHLELHREYPEAACFGCGIVGVGKSFWAKLDKVMSWVHSVPYGEVHQVNHPYHLPTTNFSIKLSALPSEVPAFEERLITGEDALLIRGLRAAGEKVFFSPRPTIYHHDRETFTEVFKHHYVWGYHQYFVQLNKDVSPRSFHPAFRALFLTAFIPCLPIYALMGSVLNLKPWLSHKPAYALLFPVVFFVWLGKAVAVAEAAFRPNACMRTPII